MTPDDMKKEFFVSDGVPVEGIKCTFTDMPSKAVFIPMRLLGKGTTNIFRISGGTLQKEG